MHTKPIWMDSALRSTQPHHPALKKNVIVDVAIVGGGITGMTAAILLQRAGKKVAIVDHAQIAMGETGHTTAHLTQILDTRYHQLLEDFGEDQTRQIATSHRSALYQIEKFVREYDIACDYKKVPGFLFREGSSHGLTRVTSAKVASVQKTDDHDLLTELETLHQLDIPAYLMEAAPLPFPTQQALRVDQQAQFNPRKYLLALAEEFLKLGGDIYEQTHVVNVMDGTPCRVETDYGALTALDVLIAANIPVTNWLMLNTKISAYRTYALAAKTKTQVESGLYWNTEDPYHYIRTFKNEADENMLIIGGEDHKTGTNDDTVSCFQQLEQYARAHFDLDAVTNYWSGQIIKPVDGLPYIGLNSMSDHVYVSTGYSGNGMTFGTLGGMLVSDQILGRENAWAPLFDATRVHPVASVKNFVSENKDFPAYFIKDRLSRPEEHSTDDVKHGEGKIISVSGKKIAAYRAPDGRVHCMSPVCPHMGCHVHWNGAESSWDCPCHGSRFDAAGKVINGPAVMNLKPVIVNESPVDFVAAV